LLKGKKANGETSINTTVQTWKAPHGGEGQVNARNPTTHTVKSVSTAIRLKKYAPSQ
jgi:hypothetical protein